MSEQSGSEFHISPGGHLSGTIQIPGDKSISHRALMLTALAEGDSHLYGFLPGEDTLATQRALAAMGVQFDSISETEMIVHGVGMQGLKRPSAPLDLGNSGTSTRLLTGLLAGAGVECEIIGDESLMRRPMGRIIQPLLKMGARIQGSDTDTLPIKIESADELTGIDYTMPVASAQLKSCLLLAGLYARGETRLYQNMVSRDHTERMLSALGVNLDIDDGSIGVKAVSSLQPADIKIPADISSAAFFIVAALIAPGSDITLPGVGINPTRNAVIDILRSMGGNIRLENTREESGEPIADIRVVSSELHGVDIPESLVPNAIDEFPAILIAAANARGITTFNGAAELRVKESDRIAAMSEGFTRLGIKHQTFDDGMHVVGGQFSSGVVHSHTDHRIAMAFAIAGLVASGSVEIQSCENVATSFPGFIEAARNAGLKIRVDSK